MVARATPRLSSSTPWTPAPTLRHHLPLTATTAPHLRPDLEHLAPPGDVQLRVRARHPLRRRQHPRVVFGRAVSEVDAHAELVVLHGRPGEGRHGHCSTTRARKGGMVNVLLHTQTRDARNARCSSRHHSTGSQPDSGISARVRLEMQKAAGIDECGPHHCWWRAVALRHRSNAPGPTTAPVSSSYTAFMSGSYCAAGWKVNLSSFSAASADREATAAAASLATAAPLTAVPAAVPAASPHSPLWVRLVVALLPAPGLPPPLLLLPLLRGPTMSMPWLPA